MSARDNEEFCIMRDYPTKFWRLYRRRPNVSAIVWEKPGEKFLRASDLLTYARRVSGIPHWRMERGRGSTVWYGSRGKGN